MCCKFGYVVAVHTIVLMLRLCASGVYSTFQDLFIFYMPIFYVFNDFTYLTILLQPILYM